MRHYMLGQPNDQSVQDTAEALFLLNGCRLKYIVYSIQDLLERVTYQELPPNHTNCCKTGLINRRGRFAPYFAGLLCYILPYVGDTLGR